MTLGWGWLATLLALLLLAPVARADTGPKFPALTGRVVDAANVIPAAEQARLTEKLKGLEQDTGRQLVVATIPDLQGYDIADYGYRLGRAWGIGHKGKDDGAILIVAPKDHRVRVEVGRGLEPVITDALSRRITSTVIVPKFKAGDLPGGIEAGTDALIQHLSLPDDQASAANAQAQAGEARAQSQAEAPRHHSSHLGLWAWVVFLALFFILPRLTGARRGVVGSTGGSGLGGMLPWLVLSSMTNSRSGWGGGFGGSDGGGSSDSFSGGGGDFGGGGASDSW